ncbi:MAG: two-component sensor histidine kinase, partial [Clostridia bacterium]|nr:two-component sensor histidine kinase [Clostridia bacterium]
LRFDIKNADGGNEIGLSLHKQGRHALLSVENFGKKIPPEQQARLFERFYRLDEVRNSEGNHYGLRLAIAKAITEAHGGSISVECRDGKVKFTVSFPLRNI